jgi:deoxycytidylate deaminase
MNNRRLAVFKDFTINLAHLSKCTERKVAAIIVDTALTQVHCIGINGGATGLDDCMCITHGKHGCLHAEDNCIAKNVYHGSDKVMMITLAPCKQCAARIINTKGGFERVYYFEDWKEDMGLKMLRAAGIQVIKI